MYCTEPGPIVELSQALFCLEVLELKLRGFLSAELTRRDFPPGGMPPYPTHCDTCSGPYTFNTERHTDTHREKYTETGSGY